MKRPILGSLLAVAALVVLALTVGASNAAAAKLCQMINERLNQTYFGYLQPAIDEASAGDTLWIRGACQGGATITKSLTLTGQEKKGSVSPTIYGEFQGSVLHITGSDTQLTQVQINSLSVTGGAPADSTAVVKGGGIWNDHAQLTLNQVTLYENFATYGGGIFNDGGTVEVANSTIDDNVATYGGGITTVGGTLTVNASEISYNRARWGGAIAINPQELYVGIMDARVVLHDAKIHDNDATFLGGGIYSFWFATITLAGTSELTANEADQGGGVYLLDDSNSFTMADQATIHNNNASAAFDAGGGIFAYFPSTSLHNCVAGTEGDPGVNVYNNTPNDIVRS